jgi:hypothetical protein
MAEPSSRSPGLRPSAIHRRYASTTAVKNKGASDCRQSSLSHMCLWGSRATGLQGLVQRRETGTDIHNRWPLAEGGSGLPDDVKVEAEGINRGSEADFLLSKVTSRRDLSKGEQLSRLASIHKSKSCWKYNPVTEEGLNTPL